jgi:ribosomal protein L37AE/L43A
MDAKDIINYHLRKQKDKENNIKICQKCRGKMSYQGIRISGNVKYKIWRCLKCNNEVMSLDGLRE